MPVSSTAGGPPDSGSAEVFMVLQGLSPPAAKQMDAQQWTVSVQDRPSWRETANRE
ncbi:hypothetical protein GCM10027597_32910 [Saccharopolyspora tripterygii]